MLEQPRGTQLNNLLFLLSSTQSFIRLHRLNRFFDVATQNNVCTSAGHVGGDGDHAGTTRLRHDIRFAGMLLGIQNLVLQLRFFQQICNEF